MKTIQLGNSDLRVSRICLGCMGFGDPRQGQHRWTLDADQTCDILEQALRQGINFFDTALAYQGGTSEQYVGRALKTLAKREDVVVATKFLPRTPEQIQAGITVSGHIEQMLNQSLENLGMDYVDLYILHRWDASAPLEEIMAGLNRAVTSGKVRYLGISNCYAYQLAKANTVAEQLGVAKFISVQGHYNLIFREEEREMTRLCAEDNLALTPYSALAGGRLAKHPGETSRRLQEDLYAKSKYDSTAEQDARIIRRVAELADQRGVSMTEIALAWLLSKVSAPIVGATKSSQIEGAARAVELELTEAEIRYLEELYQPHRLVGVMAENTGR
jgi:aryl-alcohol dehydrogenase-like predicted oxidoreductase